MIMVTLMMTLNCGRRMRKPIGLLESKEELPK